MFSERCYPVKRTDISPIINVHKFHSARGPVESLILRVGDQSFFDARTYNGSLFDDQPVTHRPLYEFRGFHKPNLRHHPVAIC